MRCLKKQHKTFGGGILGGLGFSSTGIEGPFKQAWTMDGVFNTDFIAANSIMANQLSRCARQL